MRPSLPRFILRRINVNSSTRRTCRYLTTTPLPASTELTPQSPLSKIIQDSIKITGPLSISRYIQFCLSHPTYGYYAQGDVFGSKGDFITSPEISQVFGELVAIWLMTRYMAAGNPSSCRIIELGPGRGTLMSDMLRTFSTFPNIAKSLKTVLLIENSEKMRALQGEKLGGQCKELGVELSWDDKVDEVEPSDEFTMIIAHEFFDAMPFDLFERTADGWREVVVDLDRGVVETGVIRLVRMTLALADIVNRSNPDEHDPQDTNITATPEAPIASPPPPPSHSAKFNPPNLRLAISRTPSTLSTLLPSTSPRFAPLPPGSRTEISQESYKIMRKLGHILGKGTGGGAGLIVDYGGNQVYGDSFRAFRNHEIVDVFDGPGSADLTANVDFAYLRESLQGTGTTPTTPIPQSQFLLSLGLQPRLEKLITASTSLARREDLKKGGLRLIDPLGMGTEYQVMGLTSGAGREGDEVYPFPVVGPSPAAEKIVEAMEADEDKSV